MITIVLMTALAQDKVTAKLLLDAPDPGAATGLALGLGFGAGHYYADAPSAPFFTLVEATGVGLAVTGGILMASSQDSGFPLMIVGSSIFGAMRAVEIGTAPGAAHRRRVAMWEAAYQRANRQEEIRHEIERLEGKSRP